MTIVENTAKRRLQSGRLAIGFSVLHWRGVGIARIAKTCGYDWLFIDMEHGSLDVDTAVQISVAALDSGVTPIVRVPGHEHYHATRVLDGGAMGVVVPHVNTAEQARRVAENCRYPPAGHRSLTGALPQVGFGGPGGGEGMRRLDDNILLVAMLESPEAVDNADAIAAVAGIDVLLIGSNDLAAEMNLPGELGHERMIAAYERMIAAARAHGKFAGMGGVYDQALMERYIGMGVRFVLAGGDISFMMGAAKARADFLGSLDIAG